MEQEVLTMATQFGVAGLIAWMWLSERRAAGGRERELSQAHERVMAQRIELDALVELVRDNARAVSALEGSQRELIALLRSAGGGVGFPTRRGLEVHSGDDAT
ncbi:MAG: hypothetical protein ACTS3F_01100 [Phycisphaerales bacterium]